MKTLHNLNTFLPTELNEPQRQAVLQPSGALLVTAGAGSGKTRVITTRIANLIINQKIDPKSIVALTFTNKAAGEMRTRLMGYLGANHRLPFIGTFHAYCLLLLRTNQRLLPFPQFSIMDADDQLELIKKIIKKHALQKQVNAAQVCYQLSQLKNKKTLHLEEETEKSFSYPFLKDIYLEYETEKNNAHCLDFDDLIITVIQLFEKNPDFRTAFQHTIRHILVDEYQDTNHTQHYLIKLMALDRQETFSADSLCAVGDEDQSIYSWRGATVTNMLKFHNDFAPVTHIKIEQNYRSVQPILDVANNVITNNRLRNPKNLWSTRQADNRVVYGFCRSSEQEAEVAAQFAKVCRQDDATKSVALLYRTHYQSRTLEEAFIYHGIPYKIIGGIRFYERKEIKDMLAYLRLIINPHDKISFLRIINCPARGLGQKFEDEISDLWNKNPFLDFRQILHEALSPTTGTLTAVKHQAVISFLDIFKNLSPTGQPIPAIDTILERTDYLTHLRNTHESKEAEEKIENIREFRESASLFEHDALLKSINQLSPTNQDENLKSPATLESFLLEISLMQEKIEKNEGNDQIPMMTLHAAKGLEFDAVIIAGLEEGLLPSAKSLTGTEELEEERRLFYVGITRAKNHLLLLGADYRTTFGQIVDQVASRFLSEIPDHLLQKIEFEKYNSLHIKDTLMQWLTNQPQPARLITFGPPASKIIPAEHHTSNGPLSSPAGQGLPACQPAATCPWSKNQQVKHKKFGVGIITKVEKVHENEYYITAIFKNGQKTLLSSFLEGI